MDIAMFVLAAALTFLAPGAWAAAGGIPQETCAAEPVADHSASVMQRMVKLEKGHPTAAGGAASGLMCADGLELQPVTECPSSLHRLGDCRRAKEGELCEGDGECGTDVFLNNCGLHDVYLKASPSCTPGCGFHATTYNYEAPELWGEGQPKAPYDAICHIGSRQSPIDLQTGSMIAWPHAKFEVAYGSLSNRAVLNNGHSLEVIGKFGSVTGIYGNIYDAAQFHVHAPSEHAVDGKHAAMELHVVNNPRPSGSHTETAHFSYVAAAVGILFDVGNETNLCLKQMLNATPPLLSCTSCIPGHVDLGACFERELTGPYFFYDGSVTTPPCAETVQWFVMERRATVTEEDLALFKTSAFPDPANARPLQPVNGRVVYRGEPTA